jgi:hypothetical protein
LERDLISTLEEIDRLRLKKRKQKQLLIQFKKGTKKPDEDFALLKVELEEAKKNRGHYETTAIRKEGKI